jgi:hypothetical protein
VRKTRKTWDLTMLILTYVMLRKDSLALEVEVVEMHYLASIPSDLMWGCMDHP